MKKRTSIQDALPLRKNLSSRKKQSGSVIGLIIIVLLIIVGLIPIIMLLSHTLQGKRIGPPPDIIIDIDGPIKMVQPRDVAHLSGRAGFDDLDDGDSEAASTEMVPDTSQMTSDVSSEADTNSRKEGKTE